MTAKWPAPLQCTTDVDGIPMSALVSEVPDPRATIIAIHGGATSAAYFDCPGHPRLSMLRIGAALGFTVIAIDRPGYGSSADHADEMTDPERRVDLAYRTVDGILADRSRGAGRFLLGHSNGSELTLRMAVRDPHLLGVELSGTGQRRQAAAHEALSRPKLSDVRRGVREILWQTTHLYPADMVGGVPSASPAYDRTIVANWPHLDFPTLAAQVGIPIRFTLADHEPFWEAGADALARVAALFTTAPRVVVNEQCNSPHNLSIGWTAAAYHLGVLAFLEECVAARESAPQYNDVQSEAC
jgi:pimeloyl-ACP methyl ester carboxylesterase